MTDFTWLPTQLLKQLLTSSLHLTPSRHPCLHPAPQYAGSSASSDVSTPFSFSLFSLVNNVERASGLGIYDGGLVSNEGSLWVVEVIDTFVDGRTVRCQWRDGREEGTPVFGMGIRGIEDPVTVVDEVQGEGGKSACDS